ncbi:GLH-binding kinase 1-like [Oculina patagonica]
MQFHGLSGNRPVTFFKAAHDGSTSEAKTWKGLLIDLVEAVQHVHKCGFLHDIKGDNVVIEGGLVQDRILAALIDFGKSRRKENLKKYKLTAHEKDVCARTYKHLAPELLDGVPQSEQSDIYSVGILIEFIRGHIKQMQGIQELS